jgi:hypothetical protein
MPPVTRLVRASTECRSQSACWRRFAFMPRLRRCVLPPTPQQADDHNLRELTKALEEQGYEVVLRAPDAEDPLGGVVDIIGGFGLVQLVNYGGRFPAVIEDALASEPLPVRGGSVLRVVPLPHLVALKLYAGGLASLSDIVGLLRANPDADFDAIDALCERYRLSGLAAVRRELGVSPV